MQKYDTIRERTVDLGAKGRDGKPKYVIMPIDHMLTDGTMPGLTSVEQIRSVLGYVRPHLTSVLAHIGVVRDFKDLMPNPIVHLYGQTSLFEEYSNGRRSKTLVTNMEEVIDIGAKAVSVHINWGSEYEPQMLIDLKEVKRGCLEYRLPLMIMGYPRWKSTQEGGIWEEDKHEANEINLRKAAVASWNVGGNILKLPYSGDSATYRKVTQSVPIPVVMAGGPKGKGRRALLQRVRGAMNGGAAGISIGRNIFQDENPAAIAKALNEIIVNDSSIEEAAKQANINLE